MADDFYALSPQEQLARLTHLATLSLREWGVSQCEPRLIKFRENAVFEVTDRSGHRAALRVHRQNYHSDAALKGELQWMAMLSENGMTVPRPLSNLAGSILVKAGSDDVAGLWQVDMLSWLDGRELGEVGEPLNLEGRDPGELFRTLGRTAARMHNLSSAWPQQAQMQRHSWDRDGLVGEQPFWGCFWEHDDLTSGQRALLLEAKTAIAKDLDDHGQAPDRYGLIHADLVPENVMLNDDDIQLIDFDDSGFGWHMFELVTALYWLAQEPDFEIMRDALFDGYRELRTLTRQDLSTYQLFTAARSLTYVGWVHTRKNTQDAIDLTPLMIEQAEIHCRSYLDAR